MILRAGDGRARRALVTRVVERVAARCQKYGQMAPEQPARYDFQSTGIAEAGVMLLRWLFRTLKFFLESRISRRITEDRAIVPWLL